jgi:hypothetical protein
MKARNATEYSKNSDIAEFSESLKTSNTAEGVEFTVALDQ